MDQISNLKNSQKIQELNLDFNGTDIITDQEHSQCFSENMRKLITGNKYLKKFCLILGETQLGDDYQCKEVSSVIESIKYSQIIQCELDLYDNYLGGDENNYIGKSLEQLKHSQLEILKLDFQNNEIEIDDGEEEEDEKNLLEYLAPLKDSKLKQLDLILSFNYIEDECIKHFKTLADQLKQSEIQNFTVGMENYQGDTEQMEEIFKFRDWEFWY